MCNVICNVSCLIRWLQSGYNMFGVIAIASWLSRRCFNNVPRSAPLKHRWADVSGFIDIIFTPFLKHLTYNFTLANMTHV